MATVVSFYVVLFKTVGINEVSEIRNSEIRKFGNSKDNHFLNRFLKCPTELQT